MIQREKYLPLSWRGFAFTPMQCADSSGVLLSGLGLPLDTELIVFTRNHEQRALIAREMAYHHAAQGCLAGEPYLVSF